MNPRTLLKVAQRLVHTRQPTEDALRRGVSTAYYALFHLLTQAAARELCGPEEQFVFAAARWFDHTTMAQVCGLFRGNNLHKEIFPGEENLPHPTPRQDLVNVAQAFIELQKARHDADYNARQPFNATDARQKVETAREALDAWSGASEDPWRRVFLLALLVGKKLNKGR